MNHSFNINLAKKYGIEEAILIENFIFWIKNNIANQKHFYDGRYWTYNSAKAMAQLFPYMNDKKIYRIIDNLCKINFLLKGNYNTDPFVKTLWYSFSDEAIEVLGKEGYDITKIESPFPENGNSYTDINNTDNKEDNIIILSKKAEDNAEHANVNPLLEYNDGVKKCSKKSNKVKFDVRADLSYVSEELKDSWNIWLDYKDEIKKQYKTERGAKMMYSKLEKYSDGNPILACAIVNEAICHSWDGFYSLSDKQKDFFLSDKSPYRSENSNSSYIDKRLQELDEKIEKYK